MEELTRHQRLTACNRNQFRIVRTHRSVVIPKTEEPVSPFQVFKAVGLAWTESEYLRSVALVTHDHDFVTSTDVVLSSTGTLLHATLSFTGTDAQAAFNTVNSEYCHVALRLSTSYCMVVQDTGGTLTATICEIASNKL